MSETIEVLDKVQEMGGNLAEKFEIVFGQLAEKMGQGTEYFWPIFVKQQVVEAISLLGIIGVIFVTLVCCLIGIKRFAPAAKEERDDWYPASIAMFSCTIVSVILIVAMCINLSNYEVIATGLINPEYAAIKDVVKMVKGI